MTPSTSMPEKRERALERTLFFFLLFVFVLLAHGYVDNPDAEVELQSARALVRRGSTGLSKRFADASAAEREIVRRGHGVMRGRDGDFYSWFGPGHLLAITPFYVLGEWLSGSLPGIQSAVDQRRSHAPGPLLGRRAGEEFLAHLAVSFHSPLFGALAGAILFRLLGHLGFSASHRVVAVLVAALACQFGPETRESMSDTTAAFFLFASLERALAWRERPARRALLAAGALAGFAVLTRVNHLLPALALAAYVAWHASLRRARGDLAWFGCGALPFAIFLAWFNWSRFGSVLEAGHSAGAAHGYWSFPFGLGFSLLAFSPGKGFFWFCPPLLLAPWGLADLWRRRRSETLLVLAFLLSPWMLSSFMTGWHSAQAWACRYMTPGATLLVAVTVCGVLSRLAARPSRPLALALLATTVAGVLVNLGGWITPYRGFYGVLLQPAVVEELWPGITAAGGDPFQHLVVDPRTTPITGHWKYAWLSWTGTIPHGPGPQAFSFLTGEAIDAPARPPFVEDHGFRHLWPFGLAWLFTSHAPQILGLVVWIATLLMARRLHRLSRR